MPGGALVVELVIEISQETPSESSRTHYFYGLYEHDATIANTAKGETFAPIFFPHRRYG
jgi:hypothetical protein